MADKKLLDIIDALNRRPVDNNSVASLEKEYNRLQKLLEKAQGQKGTKAIIDALSRYGAEVQRLNALLKDKYAKDSDFFKMFKENAGARGLTDTELNMGREFLELRKQLEEEKAKYEETLEAISKSTEENKPSLQRDLDKLAKSIDIITAKIQSKKEEYRSGGYADLEKTADQFTEKYDIEDEVKSRKEILRLQRQTTDETKNVTKAERELGEVLEKNAQHQEKADKYWKLGRDILRGLRNEALAAAKVWMDYNQQAVNTSKRLGMTSTAAVNAYNRNLMAGSKELMRNFGLTMEEARKMQDTFQSVTGRAILFNQSQMDNIVAASSLMGKENVAAAIQSMDAMGSTSDRAVELMDSTYARAKNSGLDTIKTTEAFVKNMSLANKMTFSSGVDGISRMTILSQRLKFNLESVAGVVDKFSTIEGAIEGSARLQMLGGTAAMLGSNPMQMMFEAQNDVEALTERLTKMWGSQARFDKKTGEARINGMQLQFIREQAKAAGMNPDDAVSIAKNQAKNADIRANSGEIIKKYGADSDEMATIENKAQYNKEKQQWEVTWQDKNGQLQSGDVKSLTAEQISEIMADKMDPVKDIKGKVREISQTLISMRDRKNSIFDYFRTSEAQVIDTPMNAANGALADAQQGKGLWGKALDTIGDGGVGTVLGAVVKVAVPTVASFIGFSGLKKAINKGFSSIKESMAGSKPAGSTAPESLVESPKPPLTGPKPGTMTPPSAAKPSVGGNITSSYGYSTTTATNGANVQWVSNSSSEAGNAGRATSSLRNTVRTKVTNFGTKFATNTRSIKGATAALKAAKGTIRGNAIAGVVVGVIEAGAGSYMASEEYKDTKAQLSQMSEKVNGVTGRARFSENYLKQRDIEAQNKKERDTKGSIGGGAGLAVGTAIGGAVGSLIPIPVVGTMLGAAVGGYVGEKIGRWIGESQGPEKGIVEKEIDEINDGDADDNIKKIVLPVESIDYNVSLIANQLGIISAMPARNNVYLNAEVAGETEVATGQPLQASTVNEQESNNGGFSNNGVRGNVSLEVKGEIKLNLGNQSVGSLKPNDILKMIQQDPSFQRELANIITNRQSRNANAARNLHESATNRRATTVGASVIGT